MVNTYLVMDLFRARKLKYHKIYNLDQSENIATVPDIVKVKEEVDNVLPIYSDDESVYEQYLRSYVQSYFAAESYQVTQLDAWPHSERKLDSDEEALDLSTSSMSDGYSPSVSPVSSYSTDISFPDTFVKSFTVDSLHHIDGRSRPKSFLNKKDKCQRHKQLS